MMRKENDIREQIKLVEDINKKLLKESYEELFNDIKKLIRIASDDMKKNENFIKLKDFFSFLFKSDGLSILKNKIDKINDISSEEFKTSPGSNNFDKIPLGNNNYRSAEPNEKELESLIKKYKIKNIIRLNNDGSDSDGLLISKEKQICEKNNCNFFKLSSTKDQNQVNDLLDQGNTLIHCHHGADRTGGNIGGWIFSKTNKSEEDTKKIWDYTTKYNRWNKLVFSDPNEFVNGGYLTQAKKFGVKDLKHAQSLASGNKQTNKPKTRLKNIIIGDSLVPYIVKNSNKFKMLGKQGSEETLWKGGMGVQWLKNAVSKYPVSDYVENVIIQIGTNGGFNMSDDISGLFSNLKKTFPNANFIVVQGTWGWGYNKNVKEKDALNYYKKFRSEGATIIDPPIGNQKEPHAPLDVYRDIANNIDKIL